MIYWAREHWKSHVDDPALKAQITPSIEGLLTTGCNTTTALNPPGCTSLVQPLDVILMDHLNV